MSVAKPKKRIASRRRGRSGDPRPPEDTWYWDDVLRKLIFKLVLGVSRWREKPDENVADDVTQDVCIGLVRTGRWELIRDSLARGENWCGFLYTRARWDLWHFMRWLRRLRHPDPEKAEDKNSNVTSGAESTKVGAA